MPASTLAELIRPGMRVAVGDGVGTPTAVLAELSEAARSAGEVDLVLGWIPGPVDGLDLGSFASVRTVMAGYSLRRPVDAGVVRYVASRLGAAPSLLHGVLRPDVVVASVGRRAGGYAFTTEVGWLRAALDGGAVLAAVERPNVPVLDVGSDLDPRELTMVGLDDGPPAAVAWGPPTEAHRTIASRVADLIPEGARVQYAPGPMGAAVLDAMRVPMRVDTGIITDAVVDLERRGMLLGRAYGPYLAGTQDLYAWSNDHVDLDRLEHTHDIARLGADPPLVAVNTALEVDLDGQVNVEAVGGSAVAGVGGQPDYAGAAARSIRGLSILAVATTNGAHTTLVDRLSAPVSTPAHDIDVVVTELGSEDLRGLDRLERRQAIARLWPLR